MTVPQGPVESEISTDTLHPVEAWVGLRHDRVSIGFWLVFIASIYLSVFTWGLSVPIVVAAWFSYRRGLLPRWSRFRQPWALEAAQLGFQRKISTTTEHRTGEIDGFHIEASSDLKTLCLSVQLFKATRSDSAFVFLLDRRELYSGSTRWLGLLLEPAQLEREWPKDSRLELMGGTLRLHMPVSLGFDEPASLLVSIAKRTTLGDAALIETLVAHIRRSRFVAHWRSALELVLPQDATCWSTEAVRATRALMLDSSVELKKRHAVLGFLSQGSETESLLAWIGLFATPKSPDQTHEAWLLALDGECGPDLQTAIAYALSSVGRKRALMHLRDRCRFGLLAEGRLRRASGWAAEQIQRRLNDPAVLGNLSITELSKDARGDLSLDPRPLD